MIRDRGRIKWSAMMLPEHVKMLREWAEEEKWEEEKTADEQTREEWGGILSQAVRSRRKRKFFGVDVISGKEIADFPENIRPVSQQMKSVRR
jgi:YolD-like protein.